MGIIVSGLDGQITAPAAEAKKSGAESACCQNGESSANTAVMSGKTSGWRGRALVRKVLYIFSALLGLLGVSYTGLAIYFYLDYVKRSDFFSGYGTYPIYIDDEKLKEVITGAENGNIRSLSFLSSLYENGGSLPKDPDRAYLYLVTAAQSGEMRAQYKLACLFWHGQVLGLNIIPSKDLTVYWLNRHIENLDKYESSETIQYRDLGIINLLGYENIEPDIGEGIRLLNFAAEKKDKNAQVVLYHLYKHGIVVEQSDEVSSNIAKKYKLDTDYQDFYFNFLRKQHVLTVNHKEWIRRSK